MHPDWFAARNSLKTNRLYLHC